MNKKIITGIITLVVIIGAFVFSDMRQRGKDTAAEDDHDSMAMSMDLADLPKRGPSDRVDKLSYVMKDGVKEFHMTIDEFLWEYADGKYVHAWGYNQQVPGPEIRLTEGDKVRIVVENNISYEPGTTIHWHGLLIEGSEFDGVPGLDQYPIKPGETFVYEYTAVNAGTHFYHTHGSNHVDVAMQDDMGLSGALIIEPRSTADERHPSNYDKEWVYLLDEWAVGDGGMNHARHFIGASGEHLHQDSNVFTINGRIFPDNLAGDDTLKVAEGDKVLIRLINNGSESIHPMHTHGHTFELMAIDGNLVPRAARQIMDVITVNPGERRDIVIRADNPGTWLFHCHNIHHAVQGMILGFLYEGYEPCCLDGKEPEEVMEMLEGTEMDHE